MWLVASQEEEAAWLCLREVGEILFATLGAALATERADETPYRRKRHVPDARMGKSVSVTLVGPSIDAAASCTALVGP